MAWTLLGCGPRREIETPEYRKSLPTTKTSRDGVSVPTEAERRPSIEGYEENAGVGPTDNSDESAGEEQIPITLDPNLPDEDPEGPEPTATPEPEVPSRVQCPPGFYCPDQNNRYSCPSGYYCPADSLDYLDNPCGPGYFCPLNSTTALGAGPCRPGRYCPEGSETRDGEGPCSPGRFCLEGSATAEGQGSCQAGYYCPEGSTKSTELEVGFGMCSRAGAGRATVCGKGFFCSSSATDCSNRQECPALPPNGRRYINDRAQSADDCTFECKAGFVKDGQSCIDERLFYCGTEDAVYHSGTCWFMGRSGESCTSACNRLGRGYRNETVTLLGSASIVSACSQCQTRCRQILTEMTGAGSTLYRPTNVTRGVGCGVFFNGGGDLHIWIGNTLTTGDAANLNVRRVCGCD